MAFANDDGLAVDVGTMFGEYQTTFTSENHQVRADLFRRGDALVAHVSFPTGLDAGSVTDAYLSALWTYAREHDYADRFKIVLSES